MNGLIPSAKLVAILAHGEQKYSDKPYSYHLRMVANIIMHYNYPPVSVAAGWLHDTLEDTRLTYTDLLSSFGPSVADCVEACTGRGANRKAKQADIFHKLERYSTARHIKLADRMANIHECLVSGKDDLLKMYLREDPEIRRWQGLYIKKEQWEDYIHMVEKREPLQWLLTKGGSIL